MKTIPLTRGYEAIVDDSDYDWLMQWKWHARPNKTTAYAVRTKQVNNKRFTVWMHREVLMNPTGKQVDHINRNTLDNRKENLRPATPSQNQFNKTPTQKHTGVYFHKRDKIWHATIGYGGKVHHLGNFQAEQEAIDARKEAELKYYPEIATHNGERVEIAIKDSGND